MNISPDSFIAVILSGFGILLCLSVGIQLFARNKGNRQANTFLGLLLVLYSLTLLNSLMAMTGVFSAYQQLYFLPLIFSFSIGPLFYFFVKSRIQPSFIFTKKHSIHFILPAIQFIFYLSIGFRSKEFKSWVWTDVMAPFGQYIEESLTIILSLGYLIAALKLINSEIPKSLWSHPICLWLRKFAISLLILLSISSIYEIVDWIFWAQFEYNLYNTAWADFPLKLSYAIISLFIGYNAFIHQNQSLIIPKYFKQNDPEGLDARIEELLQKQKIYLDPELNLDALAKMLDTPKNNLSAYFSSRGESFRTFINKHRVDHFIELIKKGKQQQLSLLGLAFESGFNSKASFNRIFKEQKGQTPKEYIQAA